MANPGWHPDPIDARRRRWFDGERWSPMASPPGASRPVWDPLADDAPGPGRAEGSPGDGSGGVSRRALAAAAACAVALVVVGVWVLRPEGPEPVAAPGTCEVAENLIRQRVGTIAAPNRPVTEVLSGGPREGDTAGHGDSWPDGGRRRWESRRPGAALPVDWAQRTWRGEDGMEVHQLVQRFEDPRAAAVWDATSLRDACSLRGAQLRRHDLGPLSLTLTFETTADSDVVAAHPSSIVAPTVTFAQVSHLDGQYRVITWTAGDDGVDRRQIDSLAYEAAARIRAR